MMSNLIWSGHRVGNWLGLEGRPWWGRGHNEECADIQLQSAETAAEEEGDSLPAKDRCEGICVCAVQWEPEARPDIREELWAVQGWWKHRIPHWVYWFSDFFSTPITSSLSQGKGFFHLPLVISFYLPFSHERRLVVFLHMIVELQHCLASSCSLVLTTCAAVLLLKLI